MAFLSVRHDFLEAVANCGNPASLAGVRLFVERERGSSFEDAL